MIALVEVQAENKSDAGSGGEHPAAATPQRDKDALRAAALKARKDLKEARKLVKQKTPEDDMTTRQRTLVAKLSQGTLEEDCLRKALLKDMESNLQRLLSNTLSS